MYKEKFVKRVMLIVLFLVLCALFVFFFPWLRNNCKIPITDGMSKTFKMMDAIGSFLCAIFAIVETTNIILGHGYSVYEHEPANKIRFIIPNNQCWRKTKYVGIDISGLSGDAVKEVVEIKNKLWDLYCIASCSKHAFKEYLTYDEHLQSIADDAINAINECREPDCENILVSKLSAITKDIDTIRQSMWLEI